MMLAAKKSLVVMVLVLVVKCHVLHASHRCKPTSIKPDIDAMEVTNIASFDEDYYSKQVANMVGYVEFLSENSTYMPVEADWVSSGQPENDGTITVSFRCLCFFFDIKYKVVPGNLYSNFYYQFSDLGMVVVYRDDQQEICKFDKPFAFKQMSNTRYSCKELVTHQCSNEGKPVARLVLKSFELELDGELESVELAQFSKVKFSESCRRWNK